MKRFVVVFLCQEKTIKNLIKYKELFVEYLPLKKMIVIVPKGVLLKYTEELKKSMLEITSSVIIEFLDEDAICSGLQYQFVADYLYNVSNSFSAKKRTGWYFQQFLKMAYALNCVEDDYLIWDSDTIPIHKVSMIDVKSGKRYFDVKTEYHEPYFATMSKIFPELKKEHAFSFISEHMLVHCNYMKDIIGAIEKKSDIPGENYWQKIINAIEPDELEGSGFSEFETYGNFVMKYFPDSYEIRRWKSLREGTIFFNGQKLSGKKREELSEIYDAISFESHSSHVKLNYIFGHAPFQTKFFIRLFEMIKKQMKRYK